MKHLRNAILSFILAISCSLPILKAQTCDFIGEVSVEAIKSGAFTACRSTGTPAACSIAAAAITCASSPACEEVTKEIVKSGCKYTVTKIGKVIRITGKQLESATFEMEATWKSLNTVEGIRWFQRYLSR